MEIVDACLGVGPWFRRDRLLPWQPADLVELMDHFGIAKALAHSNFTAGGGNAWRGNEQVAAATQAHPRLMPAFSITPFPHADSPRVSDFLDAMRNAGSRAVRFFPQQALPLRAVYGEILDACAAYRLPVLLDRDLVNPGWVEDVLRDWPQLRLLLTACGYMEDAWLFPLLKRHENLRICTGHFYIPADAPLRFLAEFPAERLVFGSGLPFFSPGGLIAHLMYAPIPDAQRAAIFGGNLLQWMGEVQL